jgi:hypothetical protein
MGLLGKVELKTTELPDALEFTVTREDALLETVAIPAITIIVMWAFFWRTGNLWLRIISGSAVGFTILAAIANRIQGGETKLRVTLDRVIAEGNLGQLFSASVAVAMSDISSIGFYDGGGDGTELLPVGRRRKIDKPRALQIEQKSHEQARVDSSSFASVGFDLHGKEADGSRKRSHMTASNLP